MLFKGFVEFSKSTLLEFSTSISVMSISESSWLSDYSGYPNSSLVTLFIFYYARCGTGCNELSIKLATSDVSCKTIVVLVSFDSDDAPSSFT